MYSYKVIHDETTPDRYNETVLEYTANGVIERFQRRGLKQDGQYGKIDNLDITLNGNRVTHVVDDAAPLLYKGALDFTDNTDGGTEYTYDGDGCLTGDKNRGIAKIDYDATGYPRRVQFMDGNVTEYVYTAAGEKLRTIHRTAAPNISVGFGQTKELTASETLNVDSTDYYGSLTAENGEAKIYNFGSGYCTFDGTCQFHYYDRDHQGNIRAVVDQSGTIEQILNYYPFGAPFCDNTTLNPDLQPYKYNGKEFETMHGRNAYDYGARLYDPLLPTWDRMDPLCEKYYHISPYAYCANDPVNAVDNGGARVVILNSDNPDAQKTILSYINKLSQGVFGIDKQGSLFLLKDTKSNGFSEYYKMRLLDAIGSDKTIYVNLNDEYMDGSGMMNDISRKGEGATLPLINGDAIVTISGKSHIIYDSEGNLISDMPEFILAHEFVGHAIPIVAPEKNDKNSIFLLPLKMGNAIKNENKVREETGQPLRQIDIKHTDYGQDYLDFINECVDLSEFIFH